MITMMLTHIKVRMSGRSPRLHVTHLRIIRNAIWVSAFVLLGKSAGAFKEMAIAYRYGVGPIVDAYQLTFSLVTWLPSTLVTVLSTVLIPNLVRLKGAPLVERRRFIAELQGVGLIVGATLTLLLFVFWHPLMTVMGARLSTNTRNISGLLVAGLLPIGSLTILVCVQSARLQARERHVNTLLECVPALTLLGAILSTHSSSAISALMWGTTLGYVFQFVWLTVLSGKADDIFTLPKFSLRSPDWPLLCSSAGLFAVGQVLMSCVTPVDQYFVAQLGDGAIGSLGYANRVLALVLGMGALAIARATLPIFSELCREDDVPRARSVARKWVMVMFVFAICIAAVTSVFSHVVISLLYQRGAFTPADTVRVAELFRWGLIQVPFYFPVLVMVQLFASEGRFREMMIIACLNFFIKMIADLCLIRWLGVAGVQVATGVMHASSLICYLAYSRTNNLDMKRSDAS